MAWLLSGATVLARLSGAFTILFSLLAALAASRLLRRRHPAWRQAPPVTIIKPLKGLDRGLYENLRGFCRLDYPSYQLLFTLASPDDPALALLKRLRAEFPDLDMEVVVSGKLIGFNPKVNNASNAAPFVKHDLILLSDSDVRVREDFLRRMTAPLGDPGVGLVTAFYRAGPAAGFWSRLESLSVNAQFLPQALVAAAFGMRFAMGAAMLVRREAFERAGGFQGMANHLADDFILGEGVKSAGYRIALADCVVESMPDGGGALECLGHQARWARTIRLCNPEGYLGSMPLHGFSWLTAKLLMIGFDPWSAALALGVLLAKAASGAFIARLCESAPDSALLLPLSEWLSCGAWLFGFRSTKVLWRGQLYEVEPRGRLVPAREPARLAEPIAAP